MRAGELRHRVTIEKPDDSASAWNGSRTWSTYQTVWAKIEPVRGNERTDEDTKKNQADVTHRITIRYLRGLKPSMRISFEGRIFSFQVIRNVNERNREMEILALEEADIA